MTLYRPQQVTQVQQAGDWTTTITSLFTAIMPLIVVMMLFKMLTPMLEGIGR